jgi:hypothetical protein
MNSLERENEALREEVSILTVAGGKLVGELVVLKERIAKLEAFLVDIQNVSICDCGDDPDPDEQDYCPYCLSTKVLEGK